MCADEVVAAEGGGSPVEDTDVSTSGHEHDSYDSEEETGPLDWSESDVEEDHVQPSGFSPYGKPSKKVWSIARHVHEHV